MSILSIPTTPIDGQKPGTSGLRKKTRVFMTPNYLENFIQSIFNAISPVEGKTLVVGGDGRFYNKKAAQIILKMAAANGFSKVIIGENAQLSTPAASHLIRINQTYGGIIMSASHNPGGEDEDFGVKYDIDNGGPAPEAVTNRIFEETKTLNAYKILEVDDIPLDKIGNAKLGDMEVEIVSSVAAYADYMKTLFDFGAISGLFASGFRMRFDAMNAITGPYAKTILEDMLGAPVGTVINATPLPDFGGLHPDPNPHWAKPLMDEMSSPNAPDFGAASDGDGDRNMIVGQGFYVVPSDSLAILAEHAESVPAFRGGLKGLARSMPTGAAVDRVAKAKGLDCYATPTGWKFFGNLLDAGKVSICGEESFGTGSDHVREKDGLWAVLFWLNILAVTSLSVKDLLEAHWAKFGRTFFSRHDYEAITSADADRMMAALTQAMPTLQGQSIDGVQITRAYEFSYNDPVDGSHSAHQGICLDFDDASRAMIRLSGTGTEGATMRIYHEAYSDDPARFGEDPQVALSRVINAVKSILDIEAYTGRTAPDVVT